jgi:hypothetical protein
MTKEILEAMVTAIGKGPNIAYLINYWDKVEEETLPDKRVEEEYPFGL